MTPNIVSNAKIAVNKYEEDCSDTKIAVGPSAPPMIPTEREPAFPASALNLWDKYNGNNLLKNILINVNMPNKTVNIVMALTFIGFSFFIF